MNLLTLAENLNGLVKTPEIDGRYKNIWFLGKKKGVEVVRSHIRHRSSQPLPYLETAPSGLSETLTQEEIDYWLDGYNSPIKYVEEFTNKTLKNLGISI